jgi:hypothetical protein
VQLTQKGLLLLVKQYIHPVDRDRLFYDKFEWSVSWYLPEIAVLRDSLDPIKINKAIQQREYWDQQRYRNHGVPEKQLKAWNSPFTEKVKEDIETVRQMLMFRQGTYKTVFGSSNITVYTNDSGFGELVANTFDTIRHVWTRQAAVTRPRDTVALVDPKHKFRTYLRTTHVTDHSKKIVTNWLEAQGNAVRPGPALKQWIDGKKRYWGATNNGTESYYFFDHNSKSYESMFLMVMPSSVRKTVELVKKQ